MTLIGAVLSLVRSGALHVGAAAAGAIVAVSGCHVDDAKVSFDDRGGRE
jgi:hypothetical protein